MLRFSKMLFRPQLQLWLTRRDSYRLVRFILSSKALVIVLSLLVSLHESSLSGLSWQDETGVFLPSQNGLNPVEYVRQMKQSRALDKLCTSITWISLKSRNFEPSFIVFNASAKENKLEVGAEPKAIIEAGFEAGKATLVLVHGWGEAYAEAKNSSWLSRARDLFYKNSLSADYNLIIMDWGQKQASKEGGYLAVASRANKMGIYLADFLTKLIINLGTKREKIHIIAHSLGSHIAGFAGKLIRPQLGRITAIEPAGPCFGRLVNQPNPQHRLSHSDAKQVVALHYDDGFLGSPGLEVHYNVYVNGGRQQPGTSTDLVAIMRGLVILTSHSEATLSKSHVRSVEVATMQLAGSACQHVAYECASHHSFSKGECATCDNSNEQCFLMDLPYQLEAGALRAFSLPYSPAKFKKFYIITGGAGSLCMHHSQILLKTLPSAQLSLANLVSGVYHDLELFTQLNGSLPIQVTVSNQMEPHVFSHLLLTLTKNAPVRRARVRTRVPVEILQSSSLKVLTVEINYMTNINPVERRRLSTVLCRLKEQDYSDWAEFGMCKQDF